MMTSVQKLSERLRRGFGIEIVEFHQINRKAIDRFSWWAIVKAERSSSMGVLGSYSTIKQLLGAKTLYLSRSCGMVEMEILIKFGTDWEEEMGG